MKELNVIASELILTDFLVQQLCDCVTVEVISEPHLPQIYQIFRALT